MIEGLELLIYADTDPMRYEATNEEVDVDDIRVTKVFFLLVAS